MEVQCDELSAGSQTVLDHDIGNGKSCTSQFIEFGIQTEKPLLVSVATQTDDVISHQISSYLPQPQTSTPCKQWPSVSGHEQLNCKPKKVDLSTSYELSTSSSESESIDSEDDCFVSTKQAKNCSTDGNVENAMYLVDACNLELLFQKCLGDRCCNAGLAEITKLFHGSMVTYKLICLENHSYTWQSQPTINRTALGNVLLSAATLYTGNTYSTLAEIADCCGIKLFSQVTFYKIQQQLLFPSINSMWKMHTLELKTGNISS